jgi:hypothetical protein
MVEMGDDDDMSDMSEDDDVPVEMGIDDDTSEDNNVPVEMGIDDGSSEDDGVPEFERSFGDIEMTDNVNLDQLDVDLGMHILFLSSALLHCTLCIALPKQIISGLDSDFSSRVTASPSFEGYQNSALRRGSGGLMSVTRKKNANSCVVLQEELNKDVASTYFGDGVRISMDDIGSKRCPPSTTPLLLFSAQVPSREPLDSTRSLSPSAGLSPNEGTTNEGTGKKSSMASFEIEVKTPRKKKKNCCHEYMHVGCMFMCFSDRFVVRWGCRSFTGLFIAYLIYVIVLLASFYKVYKCLDPDHTSECLDIHELSITELCQSDINLDARATLKYPSLIEIDVKSIDLSLYANGNLISSIDFTPTIGAYIAKGSNDIEVHTLAQMQDAAWIGDIMSRYLKRDVVEASVVVDVKVGVDSFTGWEIPFEVSQTVDIRCELSEQRDVYICTGALAPEAGDDTGETGESRELWRRDDGSSEGPKILSVAVETYPEELHASILLEVPLNTFEFLYVEVPAMEVAIVQLEKGLDFERGDQVTALHACIAFAFCVSSFTAASSCHRLAGVFLSSCLVSCRVVS